MSGERALDFIREQLSLPDGRRLAETLPDDPWLEEKLLKPILATNDEGLPLHSLAYIELSRGHYKTGACAAVAVAYALDEPGTDVIGVASDYEQAALLLEAIEGQRRRNPALARALRAKSGGFEARNGSKIRVLSSDAPSAYGIGVNCQRIRIVCDELTQWQRPDLYYAMVTTLPKVADHQLIVITNAGVGPGEAWQWGVREGVRSAGYFFSAEGTIASWIRPEDLAQVEATVPPPIFDRFYRNIWIEEQGEFVDMADWDACQAVLPPLDDKTMTVVGIDAAISSDCFAIVAVTRAPDRPEDAVAVRSVRIWRPDRGKIDFQEPWDHLAELVGKHNVVKVVYDEWQLHDWATRFGREHSVWLEPFSQLGDRNKADSDLLQLIRDRRLRHNGDPGLREHVGNCGFQVALREDTKGRLIKRGKGKIDSAVALSMASSECLRLTLT